MRSSNRLWRGLSLGWIVLAICAQMAQAQLVRGADWIVCYNLPTQSDDIELAGQFAIRDLLLDHLNRLQAGDRAGVATFTLSGNSLKTGMAGPLLLAISRALDRGASVHFVADSMTNIRREFHPRLSLTGLSRRRNNPLVLSVAPRGHLMHNKLAIFEFADEEPWTFVGSGNFTGAAQTRQWNMAVMIQNRDLYNAMATEMAEFRARRFGVRKRLNHEPTLFRLAESWGDSWVRFAPYPIPPDGPRTTAETEILRLIHGAEEEIFFAMHRFNRAPIRRALVTAANRGVRVTGVIPRSDRRRADTAVSRQTARYFATTPHYTGTNRVHLIPARASAIGDAWDSGEQDLVHTKYAVVDPFGQRPVVIHGPANWTASGVRADDGNDETTLFLRHRGMAQAFMEHFYRMTGQAAPMLQRQPPEPETPDAPPAEAA